MHSRKRRGVQQETKRRKVEHVPQTDQKLLITLLGVVICEIQGQYRQNHGLYGCESVKIHNKIDELGKSTKLRTE